MTDSPAQDENVAPNKRATRSDMEQHWAFSEPSKDKKIYKTAGDGMGGRKSGAPAWAQPEEEKKVYKTSGDGMGGRRAPGGDQWWDFGEGATEVADARASAARGRRAQAEAGAATDF